MTNLITRARALYNLDNRALTSSEEDTLDALIAAVSQAVRRQCRCDFTVATYDELYHGGAGPCLLLRHYPIVAIDRVACDPLPVLHLRNSSAANQQARVQVTDAGLTLARVAAGVASSASLTFAANVTLTDLAAAAVALGNGWEAQVLEGYGNYPSADLHPQGAFNARDAWAGLLLHVTELVGYHADPVRGLLFRDDQALRFPTDLAGAGQVWTMGTNYWRVQYSAGYDPVPEDVQEACAQWAAQLFWQTKRDPGLHQESIVGAVARTMTADTPPRVLSLLRPYRRIQV